MAERGELREDEKHEVGLKGVSNKTSRGGNKEKRNRKYKNNKRNKKKSKLATNSNASLLEKLLKKSIEKLFIEVNRDPNQGSLGQRRVILCHDIGCRQCKH